MLGSDTASPGTADELNNARLALEIARNSRERSVGRADERLRSMTAHAASAIAKHALTRAAMIVDADHAVCTSLASHISMALAMRVYPVTSAEEAIATFRNRRPAVILLDYDLGDGPSGLEVIRDIGRGPRVILYSDQVSQVVLEETARSVHALAVRKSDRAAIVAAVRTLTLDALPDTVTFEQLHAALDAAQEPMTAIVAVRDDNGRVVDVMWRYVNMAAQSTGRARPGMTLSEVAPEFIGSEWWGHMVASFDDRTSWSGPVQNEKGSWHVRIVPLGGDLAILSATIAH